jgi:hypothetical protein
LVKFSEEIRETIYDLVSKGYTYKDICAVCDITEQTFYNWVDRGKKAKSGQYKEFFVELEKAKALRKNNLVAELIDMGRSRDDWKALAWILERGYGDEFARPEVKIKQSVEAKAEVEHRVPFADLERIVIESGKKSDEEKKKE